MHQTCTQCSAPFEVDASDLAFLDAVSPIFTGKKESIPPPTHCPECRAQRRFACRNDRNYYNGNCIQCKKAVITSYSPDKHIPILCDACFFGDRWDPLSYGADYDFSKPFFEQFKRLRETVPRLAIYHTQSENSDYTVHSSRNRNCYMGSSIVDGEDVHYSDFTFVSKNSMDLFSCEKMELCYECVFCQECYQCDWCENCTNVSDAILCFDCRGSVNVIGCVGLRNQHGKILNEDATDEAIKETAIKLKTDPAFRASFQEKFTILKLKHPHRATWMVNAEHCSGNYIWSCKNASHCFNVRHMEDTRNIFESNTHKDTMDCCRVAGGELLYECASIVDLTFSSFCNLTYQCDRLLYCDNCTGTGECFGCFGLKKHRYCILNKQYTKEEYEALVPQIIEQMRKDKEYGEFFPISTSVFGYNESKAHEWFPLDATGAKANGWKWSDVEAPMPKNMKTFPASQLPSTIKEIPDDILEWAIICEKSGRPFRIVKQELEFYRNRNLPVPHYSPKQRHYDRISPHNIRILYDRTCGKCGKEMKTVYGSDRPEIVYCEECYLQTVY